ncbi:pentatricopeptide repeat-containing protein At1g09900-like [Selaginella moellendorffii]|uniref:pentatricopeptide repeat-containing protein At1g09900-like n=1 Tax=Selaginella moellendorffii TaxID=88036 RepID=UPI000D1C73B0|nr:pentatricopeptide repeat-containing protein At1g09900-like [Selaginella moellendorffii]|eukprot:XP_024516151.1 pentatricopeptide repeat-containing protein At1g09900-like [Selaginella moellendorffii]
MALVTGAIPVAIASSSSTSLAPISCSAQAVQQNVSFWKNATATAGEEQIFSGQGPASCSKVSPRLWTRPRAISTGWIASPTASPTTRSLMRCVASGGSRRPVKSSRPWPSEAWVAYNAMATGLSKAGLDEAFELMGVMESAGFALTAVTFNPVVEFLCKSGRPDEACKVMETMLLRNIEPNILTLNLILHAFCKAARPEEALGMTDIMVEMGFCPTIVTFNALLELFCNTDQMDSAAELLETMARSKCKPNFVTYSIMVQKFAEMGRMVEARAFLEQLVVCGYAPNLLVCNGYVAGLCKTGEMDLNTATYNSLVEGFCKLGSGEGPRGDDR